MSTTAEQTLISLADLTECGTRAAGYTAAVALAAARNINNERPDPTAFTLPATGWTLDANETSPYVYYYDLPVSGVTTATMAEGLIDRGSGTTARDCGLCEEAETVSGGIRFRARSAPANAITGVYWLRAIKETLTI